jgi:hypothetical protein
MGDVGTALSNVAGGIGSALSGVGQAFSGGGQGGGGIGDAISSMFQGSAAPGQTTDPAQSFQQAVDPSGSVAASEAINPPGAAPTAASTQGQGQNAPQPPPKAAAPETPRETGLDELRKLLTGASQRNPYQTGGGQSVPEGPIQDPLMPSPPLGAAGRIDTSGIPPRQPGSPGLGLTPGEANEPSAEAQGPLARSPRAAVAGQNAVEGATSGGLPAVQPQAPELPAAGGVPPLVSALARGSPLGVAGAVMQPTPADTGELPPGGYSLPAGQGGIGSDAVAAQRGPAWATQQPPPPAPAAPAPQPPTAPKPPAQQPADQQGRERPPGYQGADAAGRPETKDEYEKWLKAQGVKPSEAKKQADDSNLPTKKPKDGDRPYHMDARPPGQSNITRDRGGMQGVPAMLGELAQLAIPLIGMAMSGGMGGGGRGRFHGRGFPWGRGGHGRFGGQWSGGHPGGHGSGMYPYHHPGMGWRGFGYHPGGGWRPLHPKYAASMGGQVGGFDGGDGGGMDMSQLAPVLSALGINVPGMGGGQGGQGGGFQGGGRFGGAGGSSGGAGASGGYSGAPPSTTPGRGPNGQPLPYTGQEADQFTRQVAQSLGIDPNQASRVLQAESNYGQNYSNPNDPGAGSHGPFQLDIAPGALGQAFMQATGEDPRDPNTWKDQIVFALRYAQTRGWGPWTTAQRFGYGRGPAGQAGKQFAWNYGQGGGAAPGTTATGGTTAPNPNGNIVQRNFDNSPVSSADEPTQAAAQ